MDSLDIRLEEEDFEEYNHATSHRIDSKIVRRVFYPSPLARMISAERNELATRKLKEIGRLLIKQLTVEEYSTMQKLLGSGWQDRLYLPELEFVEDVNEYIKGRVPEIKERLNILAQDVNGVNIQKRLALYLIRQPFFLTTERETIEIYQSVLEGRANFPTGFFTYDYGRKAGIVTRHLFETLKGYTPDEVLVRATKADFRTNGLSYMIQTRFGGYLKAAIINAYPASKYPELYKKNGRPTEQTQPNVFGSLGGLVDSLDDLFGK